MRPAAQHRSLVALVHDRRGVVGLYFAVVLSVMALLAVAALDLIRVHMARSRVAMAVDSAILGSAKSLGNDDPKVPNTYWKNVGMAFFNANMNSSLGVSAPITSASLTSVDTGIYGVSQVDLTIDASVPLMSAAFGNLASMPMKVSASARNRSQVAELVMVLDNTGSMLTNDNIGALRADATQLIDILADDPKATTLSKVRVGIVPYAAAVNPGAETSSYIIGKTYDPAGGLNWKGCLIEPDGKDALGKLYALTNSPPLDAGWQAYEAPIGLDNVYIKSDASTVHDDVKYGNASTGPNVGCPTPITPMTNNIATLKSALTAMQAWSRGGTISDIGLAWGFRLLSPEAPFTQAAPFNGNVPKFLVMMTDGEAGFHTLLKSDGKRVNPDVISDYAAYGRVDQYGQLDAYGYADFPMPSLNDKSYVAALSDAEKDFYKNRARSIINANIGNLCQRLRANKVEVFTITFGTLTPETTAIYKGCATNSSHYFNAPDKATLQTAFKAIGYAITELVLVQ